MGAGISSRTGAGKTSTCSTFSGGVHSKPACTGIETQSVKAITGKHVDKRKRLYFEHIFLFPNVINNAQQQDAASDINNIDYKRISVYMGEFKSLSQFGQAKDYKAIDTGRIFNRNLQIYDWRLLKYRGVNDQ